MELYRVFPNLGIHLNLHFPWLKKSEKNQPNATHNG